MNLQPYLFGTLLTLRPLRPSDFDRLFAIASDPLIWEQHPDRLRYTKERFDLFFNEGIASGGAFAILHQGKIVGSSRYTNLNLPHSSVEIGYTFLARELWGKAFNLEFKTLMLGHAFKSVDVAYFIVGHFNKRSQRAMLKIGGVKVENISKTPVIVNQEINMAFQIKKMDWFANTADFAQASLQTSRLQLESIEATHAEETYALLSDPELHHFVPFEIPTLEDHTKRCVGWARRRSTDQIELWLNWAARSKQTQEVIGHFQVGIKEDGIASIGYVAAQSAQRKGYATEAIEKIFRYLRYHLGIIEVKAWTDTRNLASHALARKLGMNKIETIVGADHFKGSASDEYVFWKKLE